jgi:hypothetical protein
VLSATDGIKIAFVVVDVVVMMMAKKKIMKEGTNNYNKKDMRDLLAAFSNLHLNFRNDNITTTTNKKRMWDLDSGYDNDGEEEEDHHDLCRDSIITLDASNQKVRIEIKTKKRSLGGDLVMKDSGCSSSSSSSVMGGNEDVIMKNCSLSSPEPEDSSTVLVIVTTNHNTATAANRKCRRTRC